MSKLLLVVFVAFLFIGCEKPLHDKIQGTWINKTLPKSDKMTITESNINFYFYDDGKSVDDYYSVIEEFKNVMTVKTNAKNWVGESLNAELYLKDESTLVLRFRGYENTYIREGSK